MTRFLRYATAAAVMALLIPLCAFAKDIDINAADFDECHNEGGTALSGAPGYLIGMDFPGDWTQYHFSVQEYGTNRTMITLMGTEGITFHVDLLLMADGIVGGQVLDFYFTGKGFG